ncbi:hypothetical protein RhiirA4_489505, partial [Rhizophagus irregularis]
MHYEAKTDLDFLYALSKSYFEDVLHYYFLQKYIVDFWSHLNVVDKDLFELGIVNGFNKHICEKSYVYSVSNLVNLNSQLLLFQENDINSLSGKVINPKNEILYLNLPILNNYFSVLKFIWKINVKEILHKECFIRFIFENNSDHREHILKHEDVLKLEGLGWIEYQLPINIYKCDNIQLSIEINGSINMQIDYIRLDTFNKEMITCIPNIGDLLPNFHEICPNVPETFKDKYFSRKEMENLL